MIDLSIPKELDESKLSQEEVELPECEEDEDVVRWSLDEAPLWVNDGWESIDLPDFELDGMCFE